MKLIPNSKGVEIRVSDSDFTRVSEYTWTVFASHRTFYAHALIDGKWIMLHRFILGGAGFFTDHINGDGLDCRRSNLRKCSRSENQWNSRKSIGKNRKFHSEFKGVALSGGRNKRWMVRIRKFRKTYYIGSFYTQLEAAKAFNKAALKLHGRFAKLNSLPDARVKGELKC